MHPLIERVLTYSNHRDNVEYDRTLSVTKIIGSAFQAQKALNKEPQVVPVNPINRRGSSIGSGFHLWCELALKDDASIRQEIYGEKLFENVMITGTADILINTGDKYRLGDWKTGVTATFEKDKVEKARIQLSLYRWLLESDLDLPIEDEADIFYISTSKNSAQDIQVDLMTHKEVEEYIEAKLYLIDTIALPDCESWACSYCGYDCSFRKTK